MTDRFHQRRDRRVIAVRGAASTTSRTSTSQLPRDQLVVLTGLSGSGKSSLAFDTIYAEGQRRYVEFALGLRAPVPGDDAEAGRRPDRRPVAGHLHRAEDDLAQPALDRRHGHRDLRLHAAAVGARRRALLAGDRPADREPDRVSRWSTACWRCRKARGSTCWRRSCAAARASTARNSPSCSEEGFPARQDRRQVLRDRRARRRSTRNSSTTSTWWSTASWCARHRAAAGGFVRAALKLADGHRGGRVRRTAFGARCARADAEAAASSETRRPPR